MKTIIIAAGTGFMGKHLSAYFLSKKWSVIVLTRSPKECKKENYQEIYWDAKTMGGWEQLLDGAELLINLTGRSVDCRYNTKNKAKIINSRIDSTNVLHKAIAGCVQAPKLWINASTATIYRDSRDKMMTEKNGEIGTDFSMGVAKKWEHAFFSTTHKNTRQVALRTSLVLGKNGGVITPLVQLVKYGLGGHHGDGKQKFAWIHIADVMGIIAHIYENKSIVGAINCTAPNTITNDDFMHALRATMQVKHGINHPKWMLKLGAIFIGTEAELILKSRWVYPEIICESGYEFEFKNIQKALKAIL